MSVRYSVPTQVLAKNVGAETVILDLKSGAYFGLDEIGTHVWGLIGAGKSIDEIREAMLATYDVETTVLERDISDLIGELLKRELLFVSTHG